MNAANEIVNLGLKDLGYEYVNSWLLPYGYLQLNEAVAYSISRWLLVCEGQA